MRRMDRVDHALNIIREQEAIDTCAVNPARPAEHANIIGLPGHRRSPQEAGEEVLRRPIVFIEPDQLVAGTDARVACPVQRYEKCIAEECVSLREEDEAEWRTVGWE